VAIIKIIFMTLDRELFATFAASLCSQLVADADNDEEK
jgi:hypothetical protein